MTEQEKQLKIAQIDAEIARRTGDKKGLVDATNRIFQLQSPPVSAPISTSPSVFEPTSAKLARTQQATSNALGVARPKVVPVRNAPDTGTTSLVTNKISGKTPSLIKQSQIDRGKALKASTGAGDVRQYEANQQQEAQAVPPSSADLMAQYGSTVPLAVDKSKFCLLYTSDAADE